jgi:hypothetical protein
MKVDQYSWSDIKRGINDPSLLLSEFQRLYLHDIKYPFINWWFQRHHGNGVEIMEQDWDTLIILDAARHDVFAQTHELQGELSSIISQASTSIDFVRSNFEEKSLSDTVYVTANGWIEKLDYDPFFYTAKTYTDFESRFEFYAPQNVFELATNTFENYPNKRYIIHFMQPHVPYLGKVADRLRKQIANNKNVNFRDINNLRQDGEVRSSKTIGSLLHAARRDWITDKELREAYVENLKIVLQYVNQIRSQLHGKTIVTSDHGELLGERIGPLGDKLYGHHGYISSNHLRKVPWMELPYEERRDIYHDTPINSADIDGQKVEESLRALGYS